MKLGTVMDKEERNLFEKSRSRSRSTVKVKNFNFSKQRTDCHFVMKLTTVIEINKRHLQGHVKVKVNCQGQNYKF
jgi:hypothetical protein